MIRGLTRVPFGTDQWGNKKDKNLGSLQSPPLYHIFFLSPTILSPTLATLFLLISKPPSHRRTSGHCLNLGPPYYSN